MNIQCEKCRAKYNIPEDKIPESGATATCKKCGTKIRIKKATHEVSMQCPVCGQSSNTSECGKCELDINQLIQIKERALDEALSLFRQGKYADSKVQFRYVVNKFPMSYGDAKKFAIAIGKIEPALIHYRNGNYEKVAQRLRDVDTTLPEIKKVVDNLLKKPNDASNNSKKCPFCAEMIARDAVKCKHCGEFLNKKDQPTLKEMNLGGIEAYKIAGFGGAFLNFIGVFMPIVKVPIRGGMNYFQNGKGDGVVILVLAGLAVYFLLTERVKKLYISGIGSLVMLCFTFVYFQTKMHDIKTSMDSELAGNPFRGFADIAVQSVQLQWGWVVLIVGSCLIIASAKMYDES